MAINAISCMAEVGKSVLTGGTGLERAPDANRELSEAAVASPEELERMGGTACMALLVDIAGAVAEQRGWNANDG